MTKDKLFEIDTMIDNMEKNANSFVGLVWPDQARDFAKLMTNTSFQFARAQVAAVRELGDGVKKALQI